MIVATMREEELIKEVLSDRATAFRFSDTKDQKFRRMVLKSAQLPVRSYCYYTSPIKNKWIILFEARGKKEIGDLCRITFVCVCNSSHGYYAFMPTITNGKQRLIMYPPHFFSRFATRCGIDLTGIDLIRRYFTLNSSYFFEIKKEKGYSEAYGSCEEGVAMGVMSGLGSVLFKTFITYDMTKGEQIQSFAENEKIRREIHYQVKAFR